MANRYDSGLDYLNTTLPNSKPYRPTVQPFIPRTHNPLITPSQATDDISWAGGEGWSEEEFGGPGWTYGGRKRRGGGFPLGGLGGLFGGGRRGSEFAKEDFERQKELDRLVWERSTPDVTGVGGSVRWDRDKNMVTSTLSPENQAIYNAMIERQKMFGGQVDALAGGGWEDAQQKRFDQMRAMYGDSDALAEQQRLAREQATGASSTGRYWGARTDADIIDQRNKGLLNDAFLQSQALIDSNIARQYGAVGMMGDLGSIANSMVKMPSPQPLANLSGMSEGSTAWSDLQALEAAKKAKGRSDMWNSILGGISGGIFG